MILDGYKKAGRENFAAEIQKDELIYILDELKKIPEYDTKEIRKKVFESLTEIDFDSSLFSTEEEKKMIKQYKKMWNEISQMFLIGSLSGIAVLGDVIRGYLPVNLILLFVFVNMGIMLLRMYLRKKLDYM